MNVNDLDPTALKRLARMAFPAWKGHKLKINDKSTTKVWLQMVFDGGSIDEFKYVGLINGEWKALGINDAQAHALTCGDVPVFPNSYLFVLSHFCGKCVGVTVYYNNSVLNDEKMLLVGYV